MRIAIVNDVAMALEALRRIVLSIEGNQIAWIARDGAEAVANCGMDTPDLILMDLTMPIMDGVRATQEIMTHNPCPILIVTAGVDANSVKVFEALGAGAWDVVQTPTLTGNKTGTGAELKFKIETVARMSRSNGEQAYFGLGRKNRPSPVPARLLAMGASTGGPAALATILKSLPQDFPAATVIIQHVDAQFAPSMAAWLSNQSALPVKVARHGDQPQAGVILLAGTNDHLVFVDSGTLGYNSEPRDYCYRPSVDVFFQSIVQHWKGLAAGVLLTGMGRDGAKGLKAMRDAGWHTIAQDSATCAVYGMPKAAVELEAVSQTSPLNRIAPMLTSYFSVSPRIEATR